MEQRGEAVRGARSSLCCLRVKSGLGIFFCTLVSKICPATTQGRRIIHRHPREGEREKRRETTNLARVASAPTQPELPVR